MLVPPKSVIEAVDLARESGTTPAPRVEITRAMCKPDFPHGGTGKKSFSRAAFD
jgi:hypothetical protein